MFLGKLMQRRLPLLRRAWKEYVVLVLAKAVDDPATSRKHRVFDAEYEKANAERLKARMEEQLPQEPPPSAAWTASCFGWVKA
jgi:hypothetical protein